jgi:hypothetical protein
MQAQTKDQSKPALLLLAGAFIAIVAAFLDWMDFSPQDDPTTTFKGTDLTAGAGTLGIGFVLLVLGVILLLRGSKSGGKAVSIIAIIAAAFVLFAAGYSAVSPGDALAEFESNSVAEQYDIDEDLAKAAIKQGLEDDNIEVTALIGTWVATIGGAIALAGAIIGVARSGKVKAAAAATAGSPAAPPPVV